MNIKPIILVLLCVIYVGSYSQSKPILLVQSPENEGPTNCGTNTAVLDVIAQKASPEDLIIVIAHLGDRESNRALNRRRLHNVYAYLTEYTSIEGGRRKKASIIVAEGEKVNGYGRVDIYVASKPAEVLRTRTKDDLIVGTCYPDPVERDPCTLKTDKIFYPCKDRYSKRNK